ncbi:hypothetical protein N9Y42_07790 [Mariniblastus sp.]|nr:hypothetical protein [Mariniblastus sp.]
MIEPENLVVGAALMPMRCSKTKPAGENICRNFLQTEMAYRLTTGSH